MRNSLLKIVLFLCVALTASVCLADVEKPETSLAYKKALKAYQKGDTVTALMIWLPLAEAGNEQSQFILGNVYLQKGYLDNAIYWHRQAAESGHVEAQITLGLLYSNGEHMKKDAQLAAKYLLMATRNKQAMARDKKFEAKTPINHQVYEKKDYKKGMKAYKEKDYLTALMHWLPLTSTGNPDALYMIGRLYLEQGGSRKNAQKAEYWLTRAGEQGHMDAQSMLGMMYFKGTEVDRNLWLAAKWLLRASNEQQTVVVVKKSEKKQKKKKLHAFNEGMKSYQNKDYADAIMHWYPIALKGHADAQLMLGNMYLREEGIYKDAAKAQDWYQQALAQDHIDTARSLGLMYFEGEDVDKDVAKAIDFLLKAARAGDVRSQYKLAGIYHDGDQVEANLPKAAYWYQQAAQKKHADSQFELAEMYMYGRGINKDIKKALKWYKKADKSNHQKATTALARHYYQGSKKTDYRIVFKLFSRAAKQGEAEAQNYLGDMYFNGQGVEKNLVESFNWYKKAALLGYREAEYNLGKMYVNGYAVKQDFRKGVEYFMKAAKKNHAQAQKELAVAYYTNQGVDRDTVKAYAWFYMASQHSVKGADINRNRVYKELSLEDKKRANALVREFNKIYMSHAR